MDKVMYTATTETQDITEVTTIMPSDFGGWVAMNIGNTVATVEGFPIVGMVVISFLEMPPEVVWNSPIRIDPNGGKVRLMRIKYRKKED